MRSARENPEYTHTEAYRHRVKTFHDVAIEEVFSETMHPAQYAILLTQEELLNECAQGALDEV